MKNLSLKKECEFLAKVLNSGYELNEIKKLLPVDEYGIKLQIKTPRSTTKWMNFDKFGPEEVKDYLDQAATIKLQSNKSETKWMNVDEALMEALETLDSILMKKKWKVYDRDIKADNRTLNLRRESELLSNNSSNLFRYISKLEGGSLSEEKRKIIEHKIQLIENSVRRVKSFIK